MVELTHEFSQLPIVIIQQLLLDNSDTFLSTSELSQLE